MKTCTYSQILDRAAEYAGRTRDKVPLSEQVILRSTLADELSDVWTGQDWPELRDWFQATIVDGVFSKNEGSEDPAAPEMGDILGVYSADPRVTTKFHAVEFEEGDGEVRIFGNYASVFVEYQLPAPDLETVADGDLDGFTLPERFRKILAWQGAAVLLTADGDAAGAGVRMGLADRALTKQVTRLPSNPPWRRSLRVRSARVKTMGNPQVNI